MLKDDLKCLLLGRNIPIYKDLANIVRGIDSNSRFKQVELSKSSIKAILKKINGPCLIFISDEVSFPLESLSDLIWQTHADATVVVLSKSARTIPIREPFNNTQFSRVKFDKSSYETSAILQFIIQLAREKFEFRRCKNLLGISEKRCQWLVDSSREAVAFISRDIHWYANATYLSLFGISSVQQLRSITVKDLIVNDEHSLFDGFQKDQASIVNPDRSLTISMRRKNGSTFRAKAYLIPTVFKGNKCNQLWVRALNSISEVENGHELNQTDLVLTDSNELNKPQEGVDKEITAQSIQKNKVKTYKQDSLFEGVIRRKEARIVVKSLTNIKDDKLDIKLHMVSLKVAMAQKKGIDDLLMKLPENFSGQLSSVFWDKVKFLRLLQILIPREKISLTLLLRVSEASIIDESFIKWLAPGLQKLGDKSKKIVFLIPSNISEAEREKTLSFIKKIKKLKCKVALDSFSVNDNSLALLRYSKFDFVRLSLPWARQIQGDYSKELRLSGVIRQLEEKNIQVIAPCGFSKDMRRLFALSGASFCQESL